MGLQISFAKVHSYAGRDDRISVPVVLPAGEERLDIVASLNTGASHCLFQRSYGEALGLNVERGVRRTFSTANSRFDAYGHEVTISTPEIEVRSLAFFFADGDILKNVLGRSGWLDRVRLGIVDHDQLLYVAGYD